MPSTVEQVKKTIEFSPIGNQEEVTITPETIKDDSQTKKTSFTDFRNAAMVGLLRWLECCDGRNETKS